MATYLKFESFTEHMAEQIPDLVSHQMVVALTPEGNAPVNSNTVLANLTEIVYTNLSSRNITTTSSGQSPAGTYNLILTDIVLTASAAVPTFRRVVIYNDTPTSPLIDPLIGHYDHGSDVTLATSETFTIDFPAGAWISNV